MVDYKFIKNITVGLLFAVGGWAVFSLVRLLLVELLLHWGITNEVTQMVILVSIVFVGLALLGFSFKKSIKKMI